MQVTQKALYSYLPIYSTYQFRLRSHCQNPCLLETIGGYIGYCFRSCHAHMHYTDDNSMRMFFYHHTGLFRLLLLPKIRNHYHKLLF